jgi:hypothetical protein
LTDIKDIVVAHNMRVADVRDKVTAALIRAGKVPEGTDPKTIRIRDRALNTMTAKPDKIVSNRGTFSDQQVSVYMSKTFYLTVLDHQEEFVRPAPAAQHPIVLLQRWHRRSWSMGDKVEMCIKGDMKVCDIAAAIGRVMRIDPANLLVLGINKSTDCNLSDLNQERPEGLYRLWIPIGDVQKTYTQSSYYFSVYDGDLLLVQDKTEPLRALTPEEKASIALYNTGTSSSSSSSYSSSGKRVSYDDDSVTYYGPSKKPGATPARGGGGIKIKTQKDRLREKELAEAAGAAGAAETKDEVASDLSVNPQTPPREPRPYRGGSAAASGHGEVHWGAVYASSTGDGRVEEVVGDVQPHIFGFGLDELD